MITVNAVFGQEEKVLGTLGRIGENETRQIVFDCSDILSEYPGAEIVCVMQRHCDRTAYLADAVLASNMLTVTLTDADVSASGDLRIELRALADGKIRKSAVYMGQVVSALRGQADKPGSPTADVLNRIDSTLQSATETQKKLLSALDDVDTAVDGANAAADNAQTIADIVQTKLDNGDFVGAKGDKGDPGDVQDVQVAGASVLTDGVANVPIATADAPGVVSVLPPTDSGIRNDNGSLKVSYATDAEVSGRSGTRNAITCANMDYAVKAAMCDGKGAAWTAAEQKAARERVGIPGEFELIEELTLSENVTNVSREALLDGTPYDLRSLIIVVDSTNVENRQSVYGWVRLNAKLPQSEWIYISTGEFIGKDLPLSFFVYRVLGDGSIDSYFANVASTSATGYISDRCYIPRNVIRFGTHIRDFLLYSTDAAIPAGTKISIYGVQT